MPHAELSHDPGEAKQSTGGVATINQFEFGSKGRGQVIWLMWEDAGAAYNDTRYITEAHPDIQRNQLKEMVGHCGTTEPAWDKPCRITH